MFFDRFGSFSMSASPMVGSNPSNMTGSGGNLPRQESRQDAQRRIYRRRLAVLALAVTMAMPPMALNELARAAVSMPTDGVQLASDTTITDADALRQGQALLEKKQYEEALAILQQVNAGKLNDAEKKDLAGSLKQATDAAAQRKAARAEFELGEAALKDGKSADAVTHYRAAASNDYVDAGTRQKALTQIQLAEANGKEADPQANDKALYAKATEEFKEQNYAQAKADFQTLKDHGFRAPLFQKGPAEYLRDIDRLSQVAGTTSTGTATPAAQTPDATATAVAATPDATEPAAVASEDQSQIANEAYKAAREQYKAGDWIAARKNFEIARANGYKPALFQDGPEKYLARMDAKESADRAANATVASAVTTTEPAAVTTDTSSDAQKALEETARAQEVLKKDQEFRAQALVEQAAKARDGNQYEEALKLYSQAAELDSKNEAAASGRMNMQRLTGRVTQTSPLLSEQAKTKQMAVQEMQYQFDRAITSAQGFIATGEFDKARVQLDAARVAMNADPQLLSEAENQQHAAVIAAVQQSLQLTMDKVREEQIKAGQDAANTNLSDKARAAELQNLRTVAQLIETSKKLNEQGQFAESLDVIKQILTLDPRNEYAKSVLPLVEGRVILQNQKKYEDQYKTEFQRMLNDADEKKIPYNDIMTYPTEWPELSKRRDAQVAIDRGETAEDLQMQAMLNRHLPEVRFEKVTLADAIDFLRELTGANIYVNWGALHQQNIDESTPVTARLRDVRLAKALQVVLQDAGSGADGGTPVKLDYSLEEGVITISTEEDLTTNAVFEPRTYDLNDLLLTPSQVDQVSSSVLTQGGSNSSRELGSGSGSSGSSGGGFGGGGGGDIFEDSGGGQDGQTDQATQAQDVIDLIMKSVPDDTWQDNNPEARGTVTQRPGSGVLVIIQTPKNHKTIQTVLDQLRQARGVQITIEARFLTVSRSFLEDVGIDFDFSLNSAGGNSQRFSAIPFSQTSNSFTANPLTTVPGGISVAAPALSTGVAYGSILDDFQASLLITATQASSSSTTVNAPRVTLYNGQTATLVVVRQQNYVSDLTPVVGSVGLFNPTISTLNTGIEFWVRAAVSPDRKYVDMDLRPVLTSFNQFSTFTFTSDSTGTDGGTDGGGTPATASGTVQLPDLTLTTIQTFVTVPDRGTLLLGGQTIAGDVEREAGVPGLSKIPFLKRLFTNHSQAKDDQILLILVKPTIMITRESEQQAFPLLSSQVQ